MNGSGRLYIATLFVASCCVCMAQHGKPYGLKTDFIENTEHYYKNGYPINTKVSAPQNDTLHYRAAWIRTVHPSFGWVIPNKGKNVKQTAFRIIVADNRKDISALRGNIYDSGMQYDGNSVAYVPENLNLSPDKAYYWRVLVKTNRDRSGTWSSAKLFRTFHTLNDSATSHEPLVKTLQKAKTVKDKASGIFRADFKLDAFAQPMLEITAADNAEITVLIGEKLTANGKSVDTNPGATIRGAEYKLNVKKGRALYKIDLRPDKRNTGADAIKIPAFIGEITPFRYCEVKSKPGTVRHVKFMREAVNYPLNYDASSFKSSSTRLDSIFEFCKYSLKATSMLGIFVDGKKNGTASSCTSHMAHRMEPAKCGTCGIRLSFYRRLSSDFAELQHNRGTHSFCSALRKRINIHPNRTANAGISEKHKHEKRAEGHSGLAGVDCRA